MDVIDRKMTLLEAFKVADSVLGQAVGGIADIITTPGLINVDFADVRAIMQNAGTALLGIGTGVGENRAQMAARAAVSSPLLDLSMDGATGVLFNISGGKDLTMFEVDEAARIIANSADTDANIIFGAVVKEDLVDQLRITVIATGFDETAARLGQFAQPSDRPKIQGIVSEGVLDEEEAEEEKDDEMEVGPPDEDKPSDEIKGEGDVFGEKFEIPAFLRKIT
jgi:cell division protein FtsZ